MEETNTIYTKWQVHVHLFSVCDVFRDPPLLCPSICPSVALLDSG